MQFTILNAFNIVFGCFNMDCPNPRKIKLEENSLIYKIFFKEQINSFITLIINEINKEINKISFSNQTFINMVSESYKQKNFEWFIHSPS